MGKKNSRDVSKPRVEITIRKQVLGEAPQESRFVVSDGRILKDLKELADALHDMSNDVFRHHVNEFRNDFSSWVRDVFGDQELAEELSKAGSQAEAEINILRNIVKKLSR
ncbi:MAG: DUF5752 family protein [Candidatus Woesearchaeota archaeon]